MSNSCFCKRLNMSLYYIGAGIFALVALIFVDIFLSTVAFNYKSVGYFYVPIRVLVDSANKLSERHKIAMTKIVKNTGDKNDTSIALTFEPADIGTIRGTKLMVIQKNLFDEQAKIKGEAKGAGHNITSVNIDLENTNDYVLEKFGSKALRLMLFMSKKGSKLIGSKNKTLPKTVDSNDEPSPKVEEDIEQTPQKNQSGVEIKEKTNENSVKRKLFSFSSGNKETSNKALMRTSTMTKVFDYDNYIPTKNAKYDRTNSLNTVKSEDDNCRDQNAATSDVNFNNARVVFKGSWNKASSTLKNQLMAVTPTKLNMKLSHMVTVTMMNDITASVLMGVIFVAAGQVELASTKYILSLLICHGAIWFTSKIILMMLLPEFMVATVPNAIDSIAQRKGLCYKTREKYVRHIDNDGEIEDNVDRSTEKWNAIVWLASELGRRHREWSSHPGLGVQYCQAAETARDAYKLIDSAGQAATTLSGTHVLGVVIIIVSIIVGGNVISSSPTTFIGAATAVITAEVTFATAVVFQTASSLVTIRRARNIITKMNDYMTLANRDIVRKIMVNKFKKWNYILRYLGDPMLALSPRTNADIYEVIMFLKDVRKNKNFGVSLCVTEEHEMPNSKKQDVTEEEYISTMHCDDESDMPERKDPEEPESSMMAEKRKMRKTNATQQNTYTTPQDLPNI